jgi:single-strand DNA-binding protein
MNRATLIGNLGKDPEIRTTQNGDRVASFSLATSESWRDKTTGEKKERTEWHNVVVWGDGLVGIVEKYLAKGKKCLVEGVIRTRKYQDKQGVERWTTEIVMSGSDAKLILLGDAGGTRPPPADEKPPGYDRDDPRTHGTPSSKTSALDDDIPF